jgi:hypothetical protein
MLVVHKTRDIIVPLSVPYRGHNVSELLPVGQFTWVRVGLKLRKLDSPLHADEKLLSHRRAIEKRFPVGK